MSVAVITRGCTIITVTISPQIAFKLLVLKDVKGDSLFSVLLKNYSSVFA